MKGLDLRSYQQNPFLPDLLHQPDFLLVPELGRLIVVYVLSSHSIATWRETLAAVEDLFEVKQQCGEATVVYGIWMEDARPSGRENEQRFELLAGLFDQIDVLSASEPVRGLHAQIRDRLQLRARTELLDLWRQERERTTANLQRFREKWFKQFVTEEPPKRIGQSQLLRGIEQSFERTGIVFERNFRVRTAKEHLAGLPERNSFRFPIAARAALGHELAPIETLSFDRADARTKLRYLMTKGRLLHYVYVGDRVLYQGGRRRPILHIDGNLAGPEHDPYRYVRSLVSVGWHLTNSIEAIEEVILADL